MKHSILLVVLIFMSRFPVVGLCAEDNNSGTASDREKLLFTGPAKATVPTYSRVQRPFRPWKIDWENYLYRDFYPCVADHHIQTRPAGDRPPEQVIHYNEGTRGAVVQAGGLLSFHLGRVPDGQTLPRNHPRKIIELSDWSGYQLLRMDARSTDDAHVWWSIEDKVVQPPVTGNFDLKAGQWFTLEIDLEKAAVERGLDLSDMWLMFVRTNTLPQQRIEVANMRLTRRGTTTPYPVLADPKATKLPPHPAKEGLPQLDIQRDVRPLKEARALVFQSPTPLRLKSQNMPTSFVAAFDARQLLVGLCDTSYKWYSQQSTPIEPKSLRRDEVFAVQTLDGGITWQGLDGDRDRTWLHVTVRPTARVVDDRGTALLWNKDGCDNNPGPRHRLMRFLFQGTKGWTCNRKDFVFNSENYHCGITMDNALRLPSGRIWAGFYITHRLFDPSYGVHAKYSDDNGRSWHTWQEGRLGWIPGSRPRWGGASYVVASGDRVGVIWFEVKDKGMYHYWSLFDGQQWTAPELVYGKYLHSAVSVAGKTPLISGGATYWTNKNVEPGGVKRFDGQEWVREMTPEHSGSPGILCVCGDAVAAVNLLPDKEAFAVYWRSPDGEWSETPTEFKTGRVAEWMVPKFGTPTFAPILYIPEENNKEARALLVPNITVPQ